MKTWMIVLGIILSPFVVYLFSRLQMLGWKHGFRDFIKTTIKNEEHGNKEKK